MTHLAESGPPEEAIPKQPFSGWQTDELKGPGHCMETNPWPTAGNAPTKTYLFTIALRIFCPGCCRFRQFPQHLFVRLSRTLQHVKRIDLRLQCYAASPRTELRADWAGAALGPQAHLASLQKQHRYRNLSQGGRLVLFPAASAGPENQRNTNPRPLQWICAAACEVIRPPTDLAHPPATASHEPRPPLLALPPRRSPSARPAVWNPPPFFHVGKLVS